MAKMELRKLGMDPMERLFYERQDRRQKAYAAKRKKALSRSRRLQVAKCQMKEIDPVAFPFASECSVCI